MSQLETTSLGVGDKAALNFPNDASDRTFAEPWQAQAFAIAVRLSSEGHFTWPEWVHVFSEELARASAHGDSDDNDSYYLAWLVALERIVVQKGLSDPTEMQDQKDAWEDAYRHTPHGQPVTLQNGIDEVSDNTQRLIEDGLAPGK